MQGISKNLVEKAFPVAERPDYLTGPDFYKFTPAEEFMSLPGDIARTEFRLVITHEGWEYCILERDLGAHLDSQRNMLVTVRCILGALLVPKRYMFLHLCISEIKQATACHCQCVTLRNMHWACHHI